MDISSQNATFNIESNIKTVLMICHLLIQVFLFFVWFDSLHPSQHFFTYVGKGLPGFNHYKARINVSYSRTQSSDAGEARTKKKQQLYLQLSTLSLSHCTPILIFLAQLLVKTWQVSTPEYSQSRHLDSMISMVLTMQGAISSLQSTINKLVIKKSLSATTTWAMTWDVCATSKASDQPAHTRSLIRAFACRLNILWVLSYWLNIIWSFSA